MYEKVTFVSSFLGVARPEKDLSEDQRRLKIR